MMRLEDSREAGLLKSSTQYSSFETTSQTSEFDVPMFKRRKGKERCYAVSACIVVIAVAAIVSASVVTRKINGLDDSKNGHIRNEPLSFALVPGSQEHSVFGTGHGWASSPSVEATEPVVSPLSSPFSVGPAPFSYSPSVALYLTPYETICNKTINRAVCLNMFRSNPNPHKVLDLLQSTVIAMQAAEHALNESHILAQGMTKKNEGNDALQQCIDVFADALENVNTSMFLVAAMDVHHPGDAGADVRTYMSAAMTNQDTCQEGIDDLGPFPGSDQITGQRAKQIDTILSIALTFVNQLTAPTMHPDHHRRLLHTKSTGSERIITLRRRGLLSLQFFRILRRPRYPYE